MRGTIALDIDGTITAGHELSKKTIEYFSSLADSGWRFIFITGRTFQSGIKSLKSIPFPYYLAVQNGSIILEMPSKRIVGKKYLDRSILDELDKICQDEESDFVVYGGYECEDHCYYRPKRFSKELLGYLQERVASYKEIWHPLETFNEMQLDLFPSFKCFGNETLAKDLAQKIQKTLKLHVPIVRDPFRVGYYVIQATHHEISKGHALQDFIALTKERGKVIAAGDDYNDIPMLEVADVKVVMSTAPSDILSKADIIAPPASDEGIIIGLEAALKHAGNNRF